MAEVQVEEQGVVVTESRSEGQCRLGPTIRSYHRMPQHMQAWCVIKVPCLRIVYKIQFILGH
jgi:hypothetical protein